MDLTRFKKLSKIYSKLPLAREIWETPEYEEYMKAFHNDKDCQELELKRRIKEARIDYKKYCCVDMAYHLIEDKISKNKKEINYDSIITHSLKGKEFGIPIHDGGNSYIQINFCPWCGKKLL